MPFTSTDLTNIRAAISAILSRLASGDLETVSLSMGDKTIQYEPSMKTLETLQAMEARAAIEAGMSDGTYSPRTYARQGGRGL